MTGLRRQRLAIRFILVFGILSGIVSLFFQLTVMDAGVGVDFRVYYFAVQDWLSGGPVYGAGVGSYPLPYLYSPLSLLLFLPLILFSTWKSAFIVFTIAQVGAGILLAWLIVTHLKSNGVSVSRIDGVLLTLFVIGSVLTIGGIRNGNLNLFIALFVTAAAVWSINGRELAGSAILVLAVVFKVFVAFFGLWFILKRSRRAVAGCIGFGAAAAAASLAFGPELNITYLTSILSYSGTQVAATGISPETRAVSLLRPLSQVFKFQTFTLSFMAGLLVLSIIGYLYREGDDLVNEMHLLYWIFATPTMVFFKEYLEFVLFPLLALLYLVDDSREHAILSMGAVLVIVGMGYANFSSFIGLIFDGGIEDVFLMIMRPIFTVGSAPLYGSFILLLSAAYHNHYTR